MPEGKSTSGERLAQLMLALGDEAFDLVGLSASEALSQPYHIVIDIVSKLGAFDLLPHLGKPAMIESLCDGSHQRFFHGIITDGQLVGEIATGPGKLNGEFHYRLTLQPKAHFHGFGRDNRIFQEMTVRAIIKDVLDRCGIEFDEKLTGAGANRLLKYCVQFGESDMTFVSRLMEEHGIYYFYRHERDRHVMVLCDNPSAHGNVDCETLNYNPISGSIGDSQSESRGVGSQTVTGWQEFVRSGAEARTTLRDYDFTNPSRVPEGEGTGQTDHEDDEVEIYEWPGRFYDPNEGKVLANIVLEGRRAQRRSFQGSTSCTEIVPGFTFKLDAHPNDEFNQAYLVISAYTVLADETYASGGGGGQGSEVQFTAIRADTPYRAPIVTPRPVARGPETAVVVGPQDEEIYTDRFGRVKVQFHWDRLGKKDDKSSCWIRVSQTGGLGNIIIPRIGHEVLVDFINGNPDRPIIVGRVFNASEMPVYGLPDNKTRSVWRSKTYKRTKSDELEDVHDFSTGKPAANEIRFEDKTGAEEFYMHAERAMNTVVRGSDTLTIGGSQTTQIGWNQQITVHKDRTEEVKGFEKIKILKDRTEEVEQDEKITIKKNRTKTVNVNEKVEIGANRESAITGNEKQTVQGNQTIHVVGEIEIAANSKITLVCGASSITISPSSIKLSSVQIEVEGAATTEVKGGAQLSLSGGTLAQLTGAMVKIN